MTAARGCAIVRSEETHTLAGNECNAPMRHRAVRRNTLAGNEWKVRMRHRAVRRNTHAGRQRRMQRADTPSCDQKKHTRWPATNGTCGCAIVRSEETHTLAGNECNGADAASCGQKKHIRWQATNGKSGCAIVRSEETHTLAGNDWQVRMRHRVVRRNTHAGRQRMHVRMRHRACQHPESKKVVFFTVPHPLQLFRCLPQGEVKLCGFLLPHFGQGSRF